MSTESEPGHGHSPAAWTAVIIMLVGVTVGTIAFCLDFPWIVVGSAVVMLVGLLVGWIMSKMGYGVNGPKSLPAPHPPRK